MGHYYLIKPFRPGELLARMQAVLRRNPVSEKLDFDKSLQINDLLIYFDRRLVTINGKSIDLTATEFKLLSYLAHNVNRVISPDEILRELWSDDNSQETNLLRVNIRRLRQKLSDESGLKYIHTRPGLGYILNN